MDVMSAMIIASLIIWARWAEISLDKFIEFAINSFEILSRDLVHSPTSSDDAQSPNAPPSQSYYHSSDELVNLMLDKLQTSLASKKTINIMYLCVFIGLIIFSSPIHSIREIRSEHFFKSYTYCISVIYLWISVSLFSHFPLLHQLMEIQLSLFPYFLFITFAVISIINISIKSMFLRLFVFRIGTKRRFYEILHSSALISILCSMLYGECEYYNYHSSDVCELLLINIKSQKYHQSITLTPVLQIWFTGIAIICVNYVIEGCIVDRYILTDEHDASKQIEPSNTHEMVTWFSMSRHDVLLDLIMQFQVFGHRFDRRVLNAAFLDSCRPLPMMMANNTHSTEISPEISDKQQCSSSCFTYLKHHKSLWFDFMADCGDGFNSSYEVARLLAQPYLLIDDDENGDAFRELPRGQLLLIGGDLAYAGPSFENYEQKFFRVFEDAMAPPPCFEKQSMLVDKPGKLPNGCASLRAYRGPTCLVIPGNHDWFDGLRVFHRLICCRSWLGGWLLPQKHTYFSVQLPHHWWIFAADFALNTDIDSKQFQYFSEIVNAHFVTGKERVIIISHEPGWIHEDHNKIPTETNLKYLIDHVIGKDRVKLRLSGDLHNYTRHEPVDKGTTLVVSGGGGAFLHPTHCPYKRPIWYHGDLYHRVKEYPSIHISKLLSILNVFRFREKNLSFDIMGGCLYYLVVFSCFPLCSIDNVDFADFTDFSGLVTRFCYYGYDITVIIIEESYVSLTVLILGAILCYFFTDFQIGSVKKRLLLSMLHLLAHYIAAIAILIFSEMFIVCLLNLHHGFGDVTTFATFKKHFAKTYQFMLHVDATYCGGYGLCTKCVALFFNAMDIVGFHVSLRTKMCALDGAAMSRLSRFVFHFTTFLFYYILAAPVSAFILGIYLFISLNWYGKYDEGFSSLRLESYKNFLRFQLQEDGKLTCYVVAIDRVPNRWKMDKKWRTIHKDKHNQHEEASFESAYPSKWISFFSKGKFNRSSKYEYRRVKIIDQFDVH